MRKLKTATQIFKMLIRPFVFEGMTAVDCTAGNGHDTLFLASEAGTTGAVYGFDVQQSAIEATRKRLDEVRDRAPVELFNTGHENLSSALEGIGIDGVDLVVYNLGYLPKHDKSVTTMTETTRSSIRQAMKLLRPGGAVSVIAYPGHDEGARELEMLLEELKCVNQNEFDVLKSEFINQANNPPVLFLIEKR